MSSVSETERRQQLAEAGSNPIRLSPSRVAFDLFSDVPREVLVPAGSQRAVETTMDELGDALSPLTGEAMLAFATKGRSAELALVDALELDSPVVLTHGLFTTTHAALAHRGAVVEDLRLAQADGSADVDLEHLAQRLRAGGVQLVYLEVANNGLFGWPLSEGNVAGVRELCDRHGAKVVLDAARPLANSAALGDPDLVGSARRILALAHAFTISCAKEMLVPIGSVIGSRDTALVARASQLLFKSGTSMGLLDPPSQQRELRDGARYALGHPELVRDRLALVRRVGAALTASGVAIVQPVTAHAIYLPIDRALLPAGDIAAFVSVLAHLYVVSGVRAQISTTKRGPTIRLAFRIGSSLDDRALAALVGGVAAALASIHERPPLRAIDGQVEVAFFRRFSPRDKES
jgi:tryptophanase